MIFKLKVETVLGDIYEIDERIKLFMVGGKYHLEVPDKILSSGIADHLVFRINAGDKVIYEIEERLDLFNTSSIPEGYILIPINPTLAMIDAGMNGCSGNCYPKDMYHGPRAMLEDQYKAMIKAAKNLDTGEKK